MRALRRNAGARLVSTGVALLVAGAMTVVATRLGTPLGRAPWPGLVPEPLRIFAVTDALPRARLVGRTRIANGEAAFRALSEPSFDPRVEALVATGQPLGGDGFEGSVRWLERRHDRQRLETTSTGSGLIVLADAYDPGWRATIDGVSVPVLQTNVAFRGVAVPAGRRTVELVYRPVVLIRDCRCRSGRS